MIKKDYMSPVPVSKPFSNSIKTLSQTGGGRGGYSRPQPLRPGQRPLPSNTGGLGNFLPLMQPRRPSPMEMREMQIRRRPDFAEGDEVNMNMMMADQAARQGISPAEQRMMMIQKTAADMGKTISDRDAQLFGMGEISFEEAMSRARPSMDRVSGERNLMQQEQMFFPKKKSFRDSQQAFKGTRLGDALSYVPDLMQVADYMGLKNFAEGGAVESEIDKALSDIQSVQPDAMVIQQVMTMVMEMIQSGASEEQIVAALKEMGLDEEDIQQVMMMVAEEMAGQDSIDGQLAQMM